MVARTAVHSGGAVVVGAPGIEIIPRGFKLSVTVE